MYFLSPVSDSALAYANIFSEWWVFQLIPTSLSIHVLGLAETFIG